MTDVFSQTHAPPAWVPPPILDIEASGFGLGSYPVEIGYVLDARHSWCSLVKPEPSWQHWDPNAAALHGITREQLVRHGRSTRDIALHLNEQLRGLVVYTDAWAHDFTWLNKIFDVAEMVPSFRLENLRALLSDREASIWHDVKIQVAQHMALTRHRASSDARLLQMTLAAIKDPSQTSFKIAA